MWGVPSFTYANNCSRGLSCAVLMNMRVRTVGHTCSIGLTTGMVYCGAVGSFNRQDYVGIGDTVNLAARLMSKGDGVYYAVPSSSSWHFTAVQCLLRYLCFCFYAYMFCLRYSHCHMLIHSVTYSMIDHIIPTLSLACLPPSLSCLLFLSFPSRLPSLPLSLSQSLPSQHRSSPSGHCYLLHSLKRREEEPLPAGTRPRAQRTDSACAAVLLQLSPCAFAGCG
jgi:Adenylate and Guanylate cyclase catalytic domain